MPATRFHPSLIWIGILLLLLPLLLGATYKWRDEQGQVHLTDTPPPAGVPYDFVAMPPSPSPPARAPAPTQMERPLPLINEVAPARPREIQTAGLDDRRCVEALYQLELLVGKYKVYKPGAGDARTYLDDRDRPAEIERLGRVRDETCSAEQPLHGSQQRRAAELFQALSADCREAREELRLMERPDSRTSRNEYERHVEWMSRYCPDLPDVETHTEVWLADRVWQWHRR